MAQPETTAHGADLAPVRITNISSVLGYRLYLFIYLFIVQDFLHAQYHFLCGFHFLHGDCTLTGKFLLEDTLSSKNAHFTFCWVFPGSMRNRSDYAGWRESGITCRKGPRSAGL